MLRATSHRFKNATDEFNRNILVEEITHGVHEDDPWALPTLWKVKEVFVKAKLEPILVALDSHGLQALCETLGVTVFTPSRDLGASSNWIPSVLCPFDFRLRGHY